MMIDNITAGPGIEITSGVSASYINQTGVVRWNGNSQRFEVMDRDNWFPLYGGGLTVTASPALNNIMNWANIKMAEEEQLKFLCDKHPGLKDVKEKFDIMLALVRNGEFTEDK